MKRQAQLVAVAMVLLVGVGLSAQQPPTPQTPPPVVTVPGTAPAADPTKVPTQEAVAVKEVESPAAPSHATDQAIWALMVSLTIQYLKKAPWFGLLSDASTSRVKSAVGFTAAILTAAGIHFAVSGNIFDGGGASITITGISMNAFKDVAWQWASQQGWYRAVVKEPKEIAIVTAPVADGGK